MGFSIAQSLVSRMHPARHVVGAAMFEVDIAGFKFFYAGDYSFEKSRNLLNTDSGFPNFRIPDFQAHTLIMETNQGMEIEETKKERETRFIQMIKKFLIRAEDS